MCTYRVVAICMYIYIYGDVDVDSDSRLYRALVCSVTPKNEKRALFWTRSHELTRSIDKHALSRSLLLLKRKRM